MGWAILYMGKGHARGGLLGVLWEAEVVWGVEVPVAWELLGGTVPIWVGPVLWGQVGTILLVIPGHMDRLLTTFFCQSMKESMALEAILSGFRLGLHLVKFTWLCHGLHTISNLPSVEMISLLTSTASWGRTIVIVFGPLDQVTSMLCLPSLGG